MEFVVTGECLSVCDMHELVAPRGAGSSVGVQAWGVCKKGKCEHMCSADKCATSSCLGSCVRLTALWASPHGSGLMDECVWGLRDHTGLLSVPLFCRLAGISGSLPVWGGGGGCRIQANAS